jgi:CheY-like chemotaxis protein
VKPLVLVIDDNQLPTVYYVRDLEQQGFEVKHFFEPDTALAFAKKERAGIVAVLLDIMMPPGKKYQQQDTNEGLRTGVLLYPDLRRLLPDVPVIVLTNVTDEQTLGQFREGPLLKVAQKLDYPPFELAQLVSEVVQNSRGHPEGGGEEGVPDVR